MKEKKSAHELQAMIIQYVRKHPEWSYILAVSITQIARTSSDQANWSVGFTRNGSRLVPAEAFQFADKLGSTFDLA
jgi:hypothetical protein